MEITTYGTVQIWLAGISEKCFSINKNTNGSTTYIYKMLESINEALLVSMRLTFESNHYAGAALSEPIRFTCSAGLIKPGDWSIIDGLRSYSGGAVYRTDYNWSKSDSPTDYQILLDLG